MFNLQSHKLILKSSTESILKKKYKLLLVSFVFFIFGCQQSKVTQPLSAPETAQLKMLVSVVAGSKVLKTQCNRFDIPEEPQLIETALGIAKEKGWDVDAYAQKDGSNPSKLEIASNRVYTQLTNEIINSEDDISIKCSELSELLENFVNRANS